MKSIRNLAFSLCILFTLFAFVSKEKLVVVIDAGHGGKDHGAVVEDYREKDIVREIAMEIEKSAGKYDVEIHVIGLKDEFMELSQRVKAANDLNPDLLISLHVNASINKSESGARAFVSSKNAHHEKARLFATRILNDLNGSQEADVAEQNFFILRNAACPALTLEVGYLSNQADREKLISKAGQKEISEKILKNIGG